MQIRQCEHIYTLRLSENIKYNQFSSGVPITAATCSHIDLNKLAPALTYVLFLNSVKVFLNELVISVVLCHKNLFSD